jgi:hypothetical protein
MAAPKRRGLDGTLTPVWRTGADLVAAGPLRAAWSWLKQTDLITDKGQFRSRFHHPLSY